MSRNDLSTTEAIVQAIAEEYDGLRRDDALAAVDLTYGGIGGTKVRGVPHSSVMFKVQMMIFMVLNKITVGIAHPLNYFCNVAHIEEVVTFCRSGKEVIKHFIVD